MSGGGVTPSPTPEHANKVFWREFANRAFLVNALGHVIIGDYTQNEWFGYGKNGNPEEFSFASAKDSWDVPNLVKEAITAWGADTSGNPISNVSNDYDGVYFNATLEVNGEVINVVNRVPDLKITKFNE